MVLGSVADRGGVEENTSGVQPHVPVELLGREFPSGGAGLLAVVGDEAACEPASREVERVLQRGTDLDRRMRKEQRREGDVEGRWTESRRSPVDDGRARVADDDVE